MPRIHVAVIGKDLQRKGGGGKRKTETRNHASPPVDQPRPPCNGRQHAAGHQHLSQPQA
ncbi:hypothetical protein D3C86_2267950 [compost metagenome]